MCLSLLSLAAGAEASPITFTFTGFVSQDPLLDPDDPFGGTIAFNTPFSGSYVFDSTTADSDASLNGGSYTSSGGSLALSIGGNSFTAADVLNIGVGNDFSGSDFYTVFAQNTSGTDPFDLSLTFQDLNATVFASASLPLSAPPLAAFELATLFFTGTTAGNQVQIDGQLTGLTCVQGCVTGPVVPEPSTLALLGGGLAAVYFRRRRVRH